MFYSQEEDGVVALAFPVRNSLMFNQYTINPTFSFVRQQNKFISITNKREWVQFEDAPQTYLASYSGRFGENIGAGIGLFQQNYGVLTTFGGVANFAYNARLDTDSNLTFGLNIGAYKSGLNSGSVVTNFPDPSLDNIPSNFLLTINPGINYGTAFLDFGVSINNLALYNFNTSELIQNNPQQSVQAHMMYTGYINNYGFFDESRFTGLVRSEFRKDQTVISGLAMLMVPKGIWAQVGYNNLYGASGGIGMNITKQIAIEYNFEKALGDLTDFGPSHEITLAYKFRNNQNYDYSREDDVSALISGDKKKKPIVKKATTNTQVAANKEKEAEAKLLAEEKAKADEVAKAKQLAEAKAKADADAAKLAEQAQAKKEADAIAKLEEERIAKEVAEAKAKIAADNKLKAEAKVKADTEERAKLQAEAKAKAEADAQVKAQLEAQAKLDAEAKAKADEQARLVAEAQSKIDAENKAKADAETARLDAEAKAKADAESQAQIEAQARLDAEAKAKADEDARLAAEAQVKLDAENKAKADADAQAKADTPLPKDDLAISKEAIDKLTQDSDALLTRFREAVESKDKDLKDLKEENDLSDQGIFAEPKPFKSVTAENNAIEALKSDLDEVIDARDKRINELEDLYEDERVAGIENDTVYLFYQKEIKRLKAEQAKAIQTKTELTTSLKEINEATEFERKRRIKRAAFNNEEDRLVQDKAALRIIKQNTAVSSTPIKEDDFDFGEEQSGNIQILKNVTNVDEGYYLIVAVHSDVAKRDDFLTKVVASGEKDIDFFYDVNTSKYYIYQQKFESIEQANEALKSKGSKPYNGKLSLVKIEN
jgi:type IX secretion system PorP/SprF family membrane protein